MQVIAALILAFFVPTAFALNPATELLKKYETKDSSAKCQVRYENDVISIISLYQSRASFQHYVTSVEEIGEDTIRLAHSDYDGNAEVFLIRRKSELIVVGTWEDGDNGLDASSFCHLPLRSQSNTTNRGEL